jgi:hypothetical protein
MLGELFSSMRNGESRQGDYTRERFVAKSGMKRFFHRQDAKCAKPN